MRYWKDNKGSIYKTTDDMTSGGWYSWGKRGIRDDELILLESKDIRYLLDVKRFIELSEGELMLELL